MAGNLRFHDKLHRSNHHTLSTAGIIDSAYDPIASPEFPFQGTFTVNGAISSSNTVTSNSINTVNDATVGGNSYVVGSATIAGPLMVGDYTYPFEYGGLICDISGTYNVPNLNQFSLVIGYANGVYIRPWLSVPSVSATGVWGTSGFFGTGTFDRLNSSIFTSTSANLDSVYVVNKLGIGTPSPQYALHVVGDAVFSGTITSTGSAVFVNTIFSTTSALSVLNTGTGPGIVTVQTGEQPIAAFYDDNDIALYIDGTTVRPGFVGVKTITPNEALTVVGNISATGILYGSIPGYTSIQNNSGTWSSSFNTVSALSGRWSTTYSSVTGTSGRWSQAYNQLQPSSGFWQTNYTISNANSGRWAQAYTQLTTSSGFWQSDYTVLNAGSGFWQANYSTVNVGSGFWQANYSTVNANSATWSAGGGSSVNGNTAYTQLTASSGFWEANYSTVNANSSTWATGGNGSIAYAQLNASSGFWQAGYSTLNSNSGSWVTGGTGAVAYAQLTASSGTWLLKTGDSMTGTLGVRAVTDTLTQPSISLSAVTLNLGAGQEFVVNITSNITSFTLSGIPAGCSSFALSLIQDATGGKSVSFVFTGKTIKWANSIPPIITTTANKEDEFIFKTRDGGTTWKGYIAGQAF